MPTTPDPIIVPICTVSSRDGGGPGEARVTSGLSVTGEPYVNIELWRTPRIGPKAGEPQYAATFTLHDFGADAPRLMDAIRRAHRAAGSTCLQCGTHDMPSARMPGRRREYCSDACRQAAYRDRKSDQ